MAILSWLFGKKNAKKYEIEETDGHEQYLKEDFDEKEKTPKKKVQKPVEEKTVPNKAVKNATKSSAESKNIENTVKSSVKAGSKEAGKKPVKKAESSTAKKAVAKKEDSTAKKAEAKVENTVQKKANANPSKKAKKPSENAPAPLPTKEVRAGKSGRFEIKKAKDGRFVFNLYAPNHIIVATSQVYSTSSAAVNGIHSIIANAEKAPVEDNTLKNPTKQPFPKWEMYIDKGGEYRFRLYASNGNCVVHSQGYKQKSSCKNGIESIIRCSKNAEIDKSYLKKE